MKIDRVNFSNQVVSNNTRSLTPKEATDVYAGVSYSKKDLVDGLLPLIVMSDDKTKLGTLKSQILQMDSDNKFVFDLNIINGFAVQVDPSAKWGIKDKDVKVCLDGKMSIPLMPKTEETTNPKSRLDVSMPAIGMDKLWEKGYTGKGITVAIIDTGIHPHPDFSGRILAFKDIINGKDNVPYDDQGHGTHCAGDAAGSGLLSGGKYKGSAPDANLVGVKVLNKNGSGTDSQCIKGIEWAVENKDKYGIRVLSMSWGDTVSESYKQDPVCLAVAEASKKGLISVIAAGNSGPKPQTIGTPANEPTAVAVAALDTCYTVVTSDDEVAYFSSRGPSPKDLLNKPNIITPGVDIVSTSTSNGYTMASGTSMATPIMAGVFASLLQANPGINAEMLKKIVFDTAKKMPNENEFAQGAGMPDPLAALEKIKG